MQIAETLIPYFKSQKKDPDGNFARFASVQNVEYEQEVIGDVNNIMLHVKVLSDVGSWVHDLIVREFKELYLLDDEISRYNELERRCIKFDNIFPSPLINIDKENKQLVYEYNTGDKLRDLDISQNLKDYLIGRIFAMIQGEKSNPVNAENMKELLTYLLSNLPITPEEKDNIGMLLEPHYYILPNSLGGYIPCTLFDADNIEFTRIETGEITMETIDNDMALYLTMPMQSPESSIVDRMADVSSHFVLRVYKEFTQTGDVTNTRNSIVKFFDGYNAIAMQIRMPTMRELYPHGITLDIQMLLVFWIMRFTEISSGKDNWTMDDLRFTYFILLKKPFLMF